MSEVPAAPMEAASQAQAEEGQSHAVNQYRYRAFASNIVVFLLLFLVAERGLYDESYGLGIGAMLLAACVVPILMATGGGQVPRSLLLLCFVAYPGLIGLSVANDIERAIAETFGPFGTQAHKILPYLVAAVSYLAFFFGLVYTPRFIIASARSSPVTRQGLARLAPLSPEEGAAQWVDLKAPAPVSVSVGCQLSILASLRLSLMLAFFQILAPFLYSCYSLPLLDHELRFPYGMLLAFFMTWSLPAYRSWTAWQNWPKDFTINQRQRLLLAQAAFRLSFYSVLLSLVGIAFRIIALQTGRGDCVDFDPECPELAAAGECASQEANMETVCLVSCAVCQPGMWPAWADVFWVLLFLPTLLAVRFTYRFLVASRRLFLSDYAVSESFAQQLVAQGTQLHELEQHIASLGMARSIQEAEQQRQGAEAPGAASSSSP